MNIAKAYAAWRGRADLAIDLGTANTRIVVAGSGVVFDEPSLCCFSDAHWRPALVAVGEEAHRMVGRTPGKMRIAHPLQRGVLDNIEAGRELLRYAVGKAIGRSRLRAVHAVIGIPADATQAERNALLTAARDAGLGKVHSVSEPIAAAIGAGLPVDLAAGSMLVECGAGTTEIVIVSLGGSCVTRSVRIGGDTVDGAIAAHLHLRHNFLVGPTTAEAAKRAVSAQLAAGSADPVPVKGRNLMSGAPEVLEIPLAELVGVIMKQVHHIVDAVQMVLNETPPELARDIFDNGIVLTGGGAMIGLLEQAIGNATGLATRTAERPLDCVAVGLGSLL